MADYMQNAYKNLAGMARVMQASMEDEIIGLTYEARQFLKQGSEMLRGLDLPPELTPQQARLIEIEQKLQHIQYQIEQHLQRRLVNDPSSALQSLEERVSAIQKTVDQLTRHVSQPDERDAAISSIRVRVANLENLLQKSSIIPQVVHRQAQAIVELQDRIEELESSQGETDVPSPPSY